MKPHVILVLYYTRGVYPLRDTIQAHLYSFEKYSSYRYIYINLAFGFPWKVLGRMKIAGVIYQTICLSMRWSPNLFREKTALLAPLAELDVPKLAMPQDEFIHTDMLAEFLESQKITHLHTCADELDWRKIYGRYLDFNRVKVTTSLTGYIDEATRSRIDGMKSARRQRRKDIGYRAWKAAKWLGEHGQHKVRVADVIGPLAQKRGMAVDISQRDEDQLGGDAWFDFLLDCRATIGVEGGASVLDRDGSLKNAVEAYEKDHPDAGFEEVREACFPDRDHELNLAAISPRHLEACMTETCQILIEGRYNGILEADKHYIPLKSDYSNVDEALDKLADQAYVQSMVRRAYADVVESDRWTYRKYVRDIESEILDCRVLPKADVVTSILYLYFRLRDRMLWRFQALEVAVLVKKTASPRQKALYGVLSPLVDGGGVFLKHGLRYIARRLRLRFI